MDLIVSPAQAGRTVGVLLKRELGLSTTLLNQLKRRPGALPKGFCPLESRKQGHNKVFVL